MFPFRQYLRRLEMHFNVFCKVSLDLCLHAIAELASREYQLYLYCQAYQLRITGTSSVQMIFASAKVRLYAHTYMSELQECGI